MYGMNRLRHAYLEIAPELEPHFVAGHTTIPQGVYETYGPHTQDAALPPARQGRHMVVGVIDAALAGVIAGRFAATRWAQDLR